jgi:hypothetical protein
MSDNAETDAESGGVLSGLAGKAIALAILLVGAYILFKVVIGVVTAVAWVIVTVIAVVAVIWALNRLF